MSQRQARIVADEDVMGGEPRIHGRRISVRQVADLVEDGGLAAEVVADRYDLDVADVYRALTYYHDHPAELARLERERSEREQAALENGAALRSVRCDRRSTPREDRVPPQTAEHPEKDGRDRCLGDRADSHESSPKN